LNTAMYKNGLLTPSCLERLPRLRAIPPQEVIHFFTLEPAVTSSPQAISVDQPFIGPVPHCVRVNMEQMSHLGGGQHP